MTWASDERFLFIENRMLNQGFINRSHLMKYFRISAQTASSDLNRYLKHARIPMAYNKTSKRYEKVQV